MDVTGCFFAGVNRRGTRLGRFLGRLCEFMTPQPRDSVRRIPPNVSFILRYLAGQIAGEKHYSYGTFYASDGCAPRVDAQASEVRSRLGGWFPTLEVTGR